MSTTKETLVIRQASMQASDSVDQFREDMLKIVPNAKRKGSPDVIGFCDITAAYLKVLKPHAKANGYAVVSGRSMALLVSVDHEVIAHGITVVLPGQGGLPRGNYKARGILEVTVLTHGDNHATFHEAHWITDAIGNPRRDAKRTKQSEAMVERVQDNGRGRRLSFWLGDGNSDWGAPKDDEVQRTLTRGRLVAIFDALKKYPNTHGKKTLDVVGHYDHDGRVRPQKVVVSKRINSDHKFVTATYEVGNPTR